MLGIASAVAVGSARSHLGALADATSIHTAFVVVPLLLLVAFLILILGCRPGPRPSGCAPLPEALG
jgi:hypothetical protein